MKLKHFISYAAWIGMAAASPAGASVIAFGSVTDAVGDAAGGMDDLTSASISVNDQGVATFTVHFDPASFVAGSSLAIFDLDLDQNPSTGSPGVDNLQDDSGLLGVDAIVEAPWFGESYASVYTWDGTRFREDPTEYSFSVLSDGYSVDIPLAQLGATGPQMNFDVLSARAIVAGVSESTVLDYAPNVGLAVGQVTSVAPEPETVWLGACALPTLLALRRLLRR